MFEKFINNGTNTFRQRYSDTYGIWVDNVRKIRKLVNLTYISDNGGVLSFVDKDGVESKLYADSDEDIGFEFVPPVRRWYPNTKYGAVLGYRVPAHQFRKGIHDDNYRVVYMTRKLAQQSLGLSFEILDQMLHSTPTLPSLPSFTEFIEGDKDTYYLTPQMVVQKTSASGFALLVFDKAVASGRFLRSKNLIKLTEVNEVFKNECLDLGKVIQGVSVEIS